MEFCDPTLGKAHWRCFVPHDPPGVVQHPDEVGYAFAFVRVDILDSFDSAGVEPFEEVNSPEEVPGLVVEKALARYEVCLQHKRVDHNEWLDDSSESVARSSDEAQTELTAW